MKIFNSWLGIEALRLPLCVLAILIFAVFLTGGSSRPDVESLIILRPLSVTALGIAVWLLPKQQLTNNKPIIGLIILFLLLHITYFLPIFLFPEHALDKIEYKSWILESGKQEYRTIPISHIGNQNSFFSIILPVSVILLAMQLNISERLAILKLLIFFGCLSGILGLLQIIGNANGFLYFYKISNLGSAVGLFANRNHQGAFLGMLLPMLATYASLSSRSDGTVAFRNWAAISCGAVIIPLILITGSRAGLILGLVAIASSFFLYGSKHSSGHKSRKWLTAGVFVAIAGLGLMTVVMSRAEAWDRLFDAEGFADGRGDFWASTGKLVGEYFPLGTGPGGFSAAFTYAERIQLLDSTYLNHAHNDWLEWLATFGLPGIVFLFVAMIIFLLTVKKKWGNPAESANSRLLLKLGITIIGLLALASVGDYPLRTPIISSVFALALCWTMDRNLVEKPTRRPCSSKG